VKEKEERRGRKASEIIYTTNSDISNADGGVTFGGRGWNFTTDRKTTFFSLHFFHSPLSLFFYMFGLRRFAIERPVIFWSFVLGSIGKQGLWIGLLHTHTHTHTYIHTLDWKWMVTTFPTNVTTCDSCTAPSFTAWNGKIYTTNHCNWNDWR
jgi:hypothetical protein